MANKENKCDFVVAFDKDIKVPCYEYAATGVNELEVAVGTNGHKGGDSGHGSRTFFRITNAMLSDMTCSVVDEDGRETEYENANGITITLGGDSELDTFYECLRYAVNVLGKYTNGVEDYILSRREMRQQQFCMYINELCESYRKKGNLAGMSTIRAKYRISGITKELFFACGLDKARGYVDEDFCNSLYDYILDNTKVGKMPVFSTK